MYSVAVDVLCKYQQLSVFFYASIVTIGFIDDTLAKYQTYADIASNGCFTSS